MNSEEIRYQDIQPNVVRRLPAELTRDVGDRFGSTRQDGDVEKGYFMRQGFGPEPEEFTLDNGSLYPSSERTFLDSGPMILPSGVLANNGLRGYMSSPAEAPPTAQEQSRNPADAFTEQELARLTFVRWLHKNGGLDIAGRDQS